MATQKQNKPNSYTPFALWEGAKLGGVMSLHKLTAGDGYLYLMRSVAVGDNESVTPDLGSYYSQKGEAPGQWIGRGLAGLGEGENGISVGDQVQESQMKNLFGLGAHPNAEGVYEQVFTQTQNVDEAMKATRLGRPFPDLGVDTTGFRAGLAEAYAQRRVTVGRALTEEEKAEVRGIFAREMFVKEFSRQPLDEVELSSYIARQSKPSSMPVAGYDVTFSPVKSVSTLWALADRDTAEVIAQAHRDAVADAIEWLEDDAIYTRRGAGGARVVDTKGVLATAFEHRDSRAGDPDLHTHVAISNRVQDANAPEDGWFTIDGTVLYKSVVAASERYNTRLEMILRDRLGVEFAGVGRTDGLREVREIEGVSPELMASWSARRSDIQARRAELARQFKKDHGRVPTPLESVRLAQQATIETRQAKHEPRSYAEQRADWSAQAAEIMGGQQQVRQMVAQALNRPASDVSAEPMTPGEAGRVAVKTLESARSVFQERHVRAEIERLARRENVTFAEVDTWVELAVEAALSGENVVSLQSESGVDVTGVQFPAEHLRRDGSSVYEQPRGRQYTTVGIIQAEKDLLEAARTGGFRCLPSKGVELAILEHIANGGRLNEGQRNLVRSSLTTDKGVQLVLAPAGSGKTTAMSVVAKAWKEHGGTVFGLAPSASAGAVLGEQIDAPAETLAKLTGAIRGTNSAPAWMGQVDSKSLVLIDEAGLASSKDLQEAVGWLNRAGATVRLIGDDRQLAAIGAGGVLRDIDREIGSVKLDEVVRFADPVEAEVTLAVREGDPRAVGWWADNGRIHVGAADAQAQDMVTAWWADVAAGKDSLMLASTREQVRELALGAQSARVSAGLVDISRTAVGREGVQIGVGDVITTRRNERKLGISATHWVKNGDRFTVMGITADGGVQGRHHGTGRVVDLPATYVHEDVELGYASTVHGCQGMTVDTSHLMLTGAEDRQSLYVATSRGRLGNHLYVAMSTDGQDHSVIRSEAVDPQTAVEIITSVIARDSSAISAKTHTVMAHDPMHIGSKHVRSYIDARHSAVLALTDKDALARLEKRVEEIVPDIRTYAACEALRARLGELSLTEENPVEVLSKIADARELETALDPAAVLYWRIEKKTTGCPRSGDPDLHVRAVPHAVMKDPIWGPYMQARWEQVHADVADIREQVRGAHREKLPRWAHGLENDPGLIERIGVWRVLNDVPEQHPLPLGGKTLNEHDGSEKLSERIKTAYEQNRDSKSQRWRKIAVAAAPQLDGDQHWNSICSVLSKVEAQGNDSEAVLKDALSDPLPAEEPGSALWWRLTQGKDSPIARMMSKPRTPKPEDAPKPATRKTLKECLAEKRAAAEAANNARNTTKSGDYTRMRPPNDPGINPGGPRL
ncbi:relaxase domain-containing protein [Dermatophilus congolensis]|uniref:MobF family relaxase n=1 Tax=Dermatophilus congolensis TaxID=1863 RepID=UPI001AAEC201|nr:MobF family relaxase [Dermatophilus congolensis]MBO3146355.1 relaxase domain-containing protein [Dermatophilus congolensis]MBO3148602.1 relaxase domain-containing protein [Dermatophilus congolensis]MBO3157592.1 relaxase domain-containing protein [Dermatophilus congolensis]MBO3159872.1 relaxase domain-containing protein [Dermatophilus congolensis]MBO3166611.1 relaxase domain-containing protein [Dermatophilus congolensis]